MKNFCPNRQKEKLTFLSSFVGRIKDTKMFFRDLMTFRRSNQGILEFQATFFVDIFLRNSILPQ